MKQQKVFGIGFHRSGTTSLQTALEELGYRVVGMREAEWQAYADGDFTKIEQTIQSFDGFRDMPWPLLYERLYETVPNAKFILTYREPESWARSCSGNYKDRPRAMFPVIYGVDVFAGNEPRCIEVYNKHLAEVRAFFSDKPDSFLEIDLTAGARWQPLCEFLNEPVPARDFPHANNRPKSLLTKIYHRVLRSVAPGRHRRLVRDKK